MLVLETVIRNRREYASGKVIAHDMHVSRKVIRNAIRAPQGAFDYQHKVQIDPFQARRDTFLEENDVCGRRERLRMMRIHDLLERRVF